MKKKKQRNKYSYIDRDNEFFYTSFFFVCLFVFALLVYYIP